MSIWSVALDGIYSTLGADASFSAIPGETLRVVDKTRGVEIAPGGEIKVPTLVPAAAVRNSELTEHGVTTGDLVNTTVTFNGATWRITNHRPAPQPTGESEGETYLLLRKAI